MVELEGLVIDPECEDHGWNFKKNHEVTEYVDSPGPKGLCEHATCLSDFWYVHANGDKTHLRKYIVPNVLEVSYDSGCGVTRVCLDCILKAIPNG